MGTLNQRTAVGSMIRLDTFSQWVHFDSILKKHSTLSSPFMRFLFPNKNRIMQESHIWRKNINNILYTMIFTKNRII